MLTETSIIDKIETLETGHIQVRQANRIMRDDEVIATNYHRWSFAPGDDISAMPQKVKDIAAVVWTPEVIEAYQLSIKNSIQVEV